jgi:hypothetical protein
MVGQRAGLAAPVLDDGQVIGSRRRPRVRQRLAGPGEQVESNRRRRIGQRLVVAGRREDGLVRAKVAQDAKLRVALCLAGLAHIALGSGNREGKRLEHAYGGSAGTLRLATVGALVGSTAGVLGPPLKRARLNSRSTTTATHQPVISSRRSSNSPRAICFLKRARGRVQLLARVAGRQKPRRSSRLLAGRWRSKVGHRFRSNPARARSSRLRLGHTAGVDQVEVGQVRGDVESDAVVADAPLDAQAQCTQLARMVRC